MVRSLSQTPRPSSPVAVHGAALSPLLPFLLQVFLHADVEGSHDVPAIDDDRTVRAITVGFQHAADNAVKTGNLSTITWLHLGALVMQAMRVAIPAAIVIATAETTGVKAFLDKIPVEVVEGLRIAGNVVVVVGYAMVINMMSAKALMPFFFLGFVIAVFSDYNLIGLGIIGAVLAIIYIQLSPRFNKSAAGNAPAVRQAPLADDELEGL